MATDFDPEFVSLSGHDTRLWIYIETKYYKLEIFLLYLKYIKFV